MSDIRGRDEGPPTRGVLGELLAALEPHTTLAQARDVIAEHLTRIPGLFRQWELEQVITPGALYLVEKSGTLDDGSPLLAIYSCRLSDDAASILTSGAEIKAEIERLPDSDVEGDEP